MLLTASRDEKEKMSTLLQKQDVSLYIYIIIYTYTVEQKRRSPLISSLNRIEFRDCFVCFFSQYVGGQKQGFG